MAQTATVEQTTPRIAHEEFCLPRPDEDGPRIESYSATGDDVNGRPRTLNVTRCVECGAATYRPKN